MYLKYFGLFESICIGSLIAFASRPRTGSHNIGLPMMIDGNNIGNKHKNHSRQTLHKSQHVHDTFLTVTRQPGFIAKFEFMMPYYCTI
jgi:hypothetical protein